MPANTATDTTRTRAKARDKSATRLAILEAARRLAAQNGIETVTLAGAAADAGFARATVYGYFKSKNELLAAVTSNNVETLNDAIDVARAPIEAPFADVAPVFDAAPVVEEAASEEVAPVAEAPGDAAPVDDGVQLRTERRAELEKILTRLAPSDPENSEGSAAQLVRFDRRLRVVERTVADLQGHQERAEKSTTTSGDTIAESLRGLNQRLEEAERRQREAFAEFRANAREASRRLESLEGGHSVVVPFGHATELEDHQTEADAPVAAESLSNTVPTDADAESTDAPARVTYLTAARNSARIAAEAADAPRPKSWFFRIPRKYLMLVCGVLSVVVLFIGVLVVQRASAIAAQADTMTPEVAKRAASHFANMPKRLATVTPLDELSAMARSGNGKAQLVVGLKYLKGADGVQRNPVEAAEWIGRAAQRGEAMAQYWAGYVYQHGIGVRPDPDAALRWYEAAADQGNTKAMYNLGVGYAEGWSSAKDAPEASRWFARAARLGYVDAQFNLAVLYERGLGVPPNLVDAYKWYAIAAKNGDAESRKRLEALATQLGADDLAAAQRSALTFEPTPVAAEANVMPVLDWKRG